MSYFLEDEHVNEIDSSYFDELYPTFLNQKKCTVVLFYAPWCPYCKAIRDVYSELGSKLKGRVDVLAFNIEDNNEHLQIMKEDSPQLITGYPTIIMYKNGEPIEKIGSTPEDRELSKLLDNAIRLCYQDMI